MECQVTIFKLCLWIWVKYILKIMRNNIRRQLNDTDEIVLQHPLASNQTISSWFGRNVSFKLAVHIISLDYKPYLAGVLLGVAAPMLRKPGVAILLLCHKTESKLLENINLKHKRKISTYFVTSFFSSSSSCFLRLFICSFAIASSSSIADILSRAACRFS